MQCENAMECYLKIAQVRDTDSGYYQCQANLHPGSWDYRYYSLVILDTISARPTYILAAGTTGTISVILDTISASRTYILAAGTTGTILVILDTFSCQANLHPGSWDYRYYTLVILDTISCQANLHPGS